MKTTPEQRTQYLREVQYDLPNLMRRIHVLRAEEFVNNVEKLRRENRARIRCRRKILVEYAGGDQEKLTCSVCGWTKTQRIGNCDFPMDPTLAKKMADYRGKLSDGMPGGIMGECPGCTKKERDRQYPKGWSPWNKKGS